MKLFQSVLQKCENLGVSRNQSRWNGKLLAALTTYWVDNTLNCIFCVREVTSFSEMANSIFITAGTTTISICFTILVVTKMKIFRIIDGSEKIIERVSNMNPASKEMFESAIRQLEKFSGITYILITIVLPVGMIFPKAIASIIIYFTSDLGEDAFVLPTPTWFPFDWKNPIGYLIAVCMEFLLTTCMFIFLECVLVLGVAAFLFEVTTIEYLKKNLTSINKSSKSRDGQVQTFEKLSNFIEIHSMMKQIMIDFSELSKSFFMVVFTSGLVLISVSLLMINMELLQQEMDFVVLFTGCLYAFIAFIVVLIVCELCQRACDTFNNMDEMLVQWEWYLLPNKIQRMLPFITFVVQQMTEIKCFGSIPSSRETFKKILNTAYSWFMVLRNLSK